ncbi:Thymidylate kinase [Desulfurobacterium thermolithotrophum DSM 11699]|uniref:Thymidylate kinase n=1 Tax=Desulfurobacterium thermolithotrophum (strain DSM 11699 / BSA) TaxID=868864 RepID=F0S421_DESTD|nr:dTMP kinase [Desulfurobacterium thermolithotrophum]ADY73593.1 Thymidylate kinase [Desulfurobacterium thermolithotrophum DSM 11699]
MFITFEGIEGCGKSTQAKLLYDWFLKKGKEAILTREPGGTPAAEEIRNFILRPRKETFPAFAELCLYMAARGFHVENLIKPALKKGIWVVCDRFVDSTVAYQGYGRGINVELIEKLNEEATGNLKPDLTFLIDVPVEIGFSRIKRRDLDRMEQEEMDFHERVRQGFLRIAEKNSERVIVIDGTKKVDEIFDEILNTLKKRGNINAL